MYGSLDENGQRVGCPIKASRIGDYATLPQIEKLYAGNKEYLKDLPRRRELADRIRRIVTDCMQRGETSQAHIERRLEEKNITAVFRTNEDGRLTGATLIDHQGKTVYNGSNLGKDLSANSWHSLFNESAGSLYQPQVEPMQTAVEPEQSTMVEMPTEIPPLRPETGGFTEEYEEAWERLPSEDRGHKPYHKIHTGLWLFGDKPGQNPDFDEIDPEIKPPYKKKRKLKYRL